MKPNDAYGEFITPSEVRLVRLLPGPIERLWEYLVDDEKRSRWFAGGPLERRKGGAVRLLVDHKKLAANEVPDPATAHKSCSDEMPGTVTRYEPPRVLAYTFGKTGDSEVTFELIPQGDHIQLVLTHRSGSTDLPFINGFAGGWHTYLDHLTAEVSGLPRPAYWALHAKYREDYAKLRAKM